MGRVLDKVPFKLLVPCFILAFYLSILLYLVLSPFIFLYGLLLCARAWIEWDRQGKDVVLVHMAGVHSTEWLSRIFPLVGRRAILLNYDERDEWDGQSLAVQLFNIFGPHAIPERFTPHSLPAVILFKKFRLPKKFTFGERSKEREARLERLSGDLAKN